MQESIQYVTYQSALFFLRPELAEFPGKAEPLWKGSVRRTDDRSLHERPRAGTNGHGYSRTNSQQAVILWLSLPKQCLVEPGPSRSSDPPDADLHNVV